MRGASDGEIAVAHTFAMNSRRFMSISLSGREATPMDPSESRTTKVGGVHSKSLKARATLRLSSISALSGLPPETCR